MATIIAGSLAEFTVMVLADGEPIAVTGDVTARVFSMDGRQLMAEKSLVEADAWSDGAVTVSLDEAETAVLPDGECMLVLAGPFGVRRFSLRIEPLFIGTRTSLFIRDIVVDQLRRDSLVAAAAGVLQDVKFTDDYLWSKVAAAESEIAHILRVPLVPTKFFPYPPSDAEIQALDGMAWEVEPGYDYDPTMWERDKWGYLVTRNRPIIEVQKIAFAYPGRDSGLFNIPTDWLRVDQKYGHIRMVPSSNAPLAAINGFAMSALANGRNIPSMVQVTYTAGLQNVSAAFPELLDIIKKKAVIKIIGDAFLPSSGSISADGLSQSLSIDMDKYNAIIDETINGPKGSNGGLMTKIHGIRLMVA